MQDERTIGVSQGCTLGTVHRRPQRVVAGHFAYFAVPTNSRELSAFRHWVTDLWRRTLRRRSQRDGFTWDRITKLADDWLPKPPNHI